MSVDKTNLIVNYLPSSYDRDDVRGMFERIGPITMCKLVHSKTTGESLGYAFITYKGEADAAKAINQLTGLEMEGKRLKVSYARNNSGADEPKDTNVYVANIPPTFTDSQLYDVFTGYGAILSHKVLTNPDGSSRGCGLVRFTANQEAQNAISALNNHRLPDAKQPLIVKFALPAASKNDPSALNSTFTNTIAGVGAAARNPNMRYNPMGGGGGGNGEMPAYYGQGGVNMSASQLAQQQMGLMNQQQSYADPYQRQMNPMSVGGGGGGIGCVYVYGLQPEHTELTLYHLFSPFGAIHSARIIVDLSKEEKPCKGYGFVNFQKMDEALMAIASMNGVEFEEKVLSVSLKK